MKTRVLIITYQDFTQSNDELDKDIPGNKETLSEYINGQIDLIKDEGHLFNKIDIFPLTDFPHSPIAAIQYFEK